MKKLISLVLAAIMLMACCSFASAEAEVPEGYPAIIEGLDFGGQTIWIYDWWSNGDEEHSDRTKDPDEDTQKLYEYRDWLEKTYNCKIVEYNLTGNYLTITSEGLVNMVQSKDNSKLCIFTTDPNAVAGPLKNGMFMPWKIDLSADYWNKACIEFGTYKGEVYGVNTGDSQPRECVFFNKKLLEDAGIDYNEIYDAEKDGTWTWEKMEEYMDKVQKDTDNDGVIDIWGVTGNGGRLTRGLVYGNDARFFGYNEEGKLAPMMTSDACMAGLNKRYEWAQKYFPQKNDIAPDGEWNWFEGFWKEGKCLFFAGQAYEGFTEGSLMTQCDFDWGCVAFPKGPNASDYMYADVTNLMVIPNVYDDETSLKLQQIFALYRMPTPGVDEETAWIQPFWANTLSDDRCVEEYYDMMRTKGIANLQYLLGDEEAVMGPPLYYQIDWRAPSESVEAGLPDWQFRCDVFNGDKTEDDYNKFLEEKAAAEAAAAEAAAAEAAAEEAPAE